MSEDAYIEKLKWFKENEKPEVVLFVADDATLTKICFAWTNTFACREEEISRLQDESKHEVWQWLWKNTVYDSKAFRAKCPHPTPDLSGKIESLIGNRALYPDGTINSYLERFIRQKVLKLFETKPSRAPKRPAK